MKTSNTRISFSTKVSLVSFVLCCGVVSQHVQWKCHDYEWLNAMQSFWFFIVESCVPFFFMLSGYLFFRTYKSSKWKDKLVSRARTLLIPYLIWNIIYTFAFALLYKAGVSQNIHVADSVLGGGFSCVNSEYSPLWFVKYLMVFVCISPLTYYLLRNKAAGALLLLVLLVVNAFNYYSDRLQMPLDFNSNNWMILTYQYIFFAMGSYCALCWKALVEEASPVKAKTGLAVLLILVTLYWSFIVYKGDVITNHTFRWLWCIALWYAMDLLPEVKVRKWMKYSFFIYCAHYLLVLCAQGATELLYAKVSVLQQYLQIAEYLWLPLLTVYVFIQIGNVCSEKMPRCWNQITGGRG